MEPKNLATSLHNNTSIEKADSDEMTVIVDATNQHLVPTSGMTVFNQQEKKIFTVDNKIASDHIEGETVFVTTEDDGAGGTITYVQNLPNNTVSNEDGTLGTEYVIEEGLQDGDTETENGMINLYITVDHKVVLSNMHNDDQSL